MSDLRQLKSSFHMHGENEIVKIRFDVKVVKTTKSSFERQILESVVIQKERHHHLLLNSRADYNRCAVPRLTTKIGESQYKKWEKN